MKASDNREARVKGEASESHKGRILQSLARWSLSCSAEGKEETVADRRTGYYVAGHDWPAISSDIPLSEIYRALDGLDDAVVGAALDTLKVVEVPPENSQDALDPAN